MIIIQGAFFTDNEPSFIWICEWEINMLFQIEHFWTEYKVPTIYEM